MSVFEAVKIMGKEDFAAFCEALYNKGWKDGADLLDDGPWVRHRLADYPIDRFEDDVK